MRQFPLEVLNYGWERLDGESVPATGQRLGVGAWFGGTGMTLKPASTQLCLPGYSEYEPMSQAW